MKKVPVLPVVLLNLTYWTVKDGIQKKRGMNPIAFSVWLQRGKLH